MLTTKRDFTLTASLFGTIEVKREDWLVDKAVADHVIEWSFGT